MAIIKPTKPDSELPKTWGGTQYPYTEEQIAEGLPEAIPTIIDGGTLNYEKKGVFERLDYVTKVADVVNNLPIGKTITSDSNNRFEYATVATVASDEEYVDGTATEKVPSVAQVRDSFLDIDGKITNCITEIPQDIKLELNNGVLTMKAGSKVYVPNGKNTDGSLKFNEVVIASDISFSGTIGTSSRPSMWFLGADDTSFTSGVALHERPLADQQSGTSTPSTAVAYYNTSENLIHGSGTTKTTKYCFPLCIITLSNGALTSIDQVFNGFGYIGSTVFALPGVKGLIPNGRNADGSLKNIEYTTSSVLTRTLTSQKLSVAWFCFNPKNSPVFGLSDSKAFDYDITYNHNLLDGVRWDYTPIGRATVTNGIISDFMIRTAFHAVDRNDSSWIAAQSAPSEKSIILSIGADKAQYTAPADGYVCFSRMATGSNQSVSLYVDGITTYSKIYSSANNQQLVVSARVGKGKKFNIGYSHSSSDTYLKFVYAEGEN